MAFGGSGIGSRHLSTVLRDASQRKNVPADVRLHQDFFKIRPIIGVTRFMGIIVPGVLLAMWSWIALAEAVKHGHSWTRYLMYGLVFVAWFLLIIAAKSAIWKFMSKIFDRARRSAG